MQEILGAVFTVASLVGFISAVVIHLRAEHRKQQGWENPERPAVD